MKTVFCKFHVLLGFTLISLFVAESALALSPADVSRARVDGTLVEVHLVAPASTSARELWESYLKWLYIDSLDVYVKSSDAGNRLTAYAFKLEGGSLGGLPGGTPVLVTLSDVSNSLTGLKTLLNGGDATQEHLLVDESCSSTQRRSPYADKNPSFLCTAVGAGKPHGAFSIGEPSLFALADGLDTSSLYGSAIAQGIFGIAVNKKLYLALQKAQGLVPTSATAIDESAAAQPSLPKTFIAGALTGQILGSSSNKKGWNLLIPASVDSNINNKRVNVCRRTPGSGTQAASNLYFANNPCGGANQYTPTAGSTSATLAVTGSITTLQNSTTQDVENCLFNVEGLADSTGGAYGFSILSLASNPLKTEAGAAVDRGYRFAKISQAAPTKANVIAGNYELSLEIHLNWPRRGFDNSPNDKTEDFLYSMLQKAGRPCMISSSLSLLATPDKSYTSACSPLYGVYDEAPTTYFSWFDNPLRNSISHMQRSNSCAPSRMTK